VVWVLRIADDCWSWVVCYFDDFGRICSIIGMVRVFARMDLFGRRRMYCIVGFIGFCVEGVLFTVVE